MSQKAHGTCTGMPPKNLRWGCAIETADNICCFNRHYAEYSTYWTTTSFLRDPFGGAPSDVKVPTEDNPVVFYDTITNKPLYVAPQGRSWESFVKESNSHGWPSFRDAEVVAENVRVLSNGELVSVDGTHLGHNLPDFSGNRHCVNLVSVAAMPPTK